MESGPKCDDFTLHVKLIHPLLHASVVTRMCVYLRVTVPTCEWKGGGREKEWGREIGGVA